MGEPAFQRLGDFEIVRELGRGGMGIVYEARQISLNRKVALKVLTAGLGLTSKAVERFRREAESAAKLHHTNIVPVYATGQDDGTHFYAMELIEGFSLDHHIRQMREPRDGNSADASKILASELDATGPYIESARLSSSVSGTSLSSGSNYFDDVARMIADVADALEHAHKSGVIHRDIKPSNLLLAPDGRLSVNDFGLARILEQPGMTQTGEFLGTPRYMSPEQIAGGRVPVDHRTDIYSLGATLYELLTLQPPFTGEHRDQLLAQILQKDAVAPRRLNKKVPIDLETICLKAMEKDPDRRYASASAFADDLRRYVNRFAILARRAGPMTRTIKWIRRHPALAGALAAVLIALGVAGAMAYRVHLSELDRLAERAEHERELLEEKRRNALDKAFLAVRQDDFQTAEEAIREAERLECSAGQLRMLRGQVALYQGQTKDAVAHLEQAVELMPQSVAARAMLSVAYNSAGKPSSANQALAEAMRLPTVTPEDLLFRGHAECALDPERALVTLNQLVKLRPSVVARLVRAEALRMNLMINPRVEQAELAMDDIRLIKRQMPDNAMAFSLSVSLNLVCYNVFDEFKRETQRQTALDEAWKDARALERYPHLATAVLARCVFLQEMGQIEAGLADLRKIVETTKHENATYYYAVVLYRRGEFELAAKALANTKGDLANEIVRAIVLAELPDGPKRANELYAEIAAKDLKDWDLYNSQQLLRLLGRKKEAEEVSRRFLQQPERFPPVRHAQFRKAVGYCAGEITADDLLNSLQGSRGDLVNAHFSIALTALSDGKRDLAKKQFELAVRTRILEYIPYDLSAMFLSRMEKDPAWPTWIAAK